VGKHSAKAAELQDESINLPDNIEVIIAPLKFIGTGLSVSVF
jgi:hypothetical protein